MKYFIPLLMLCSSNCLADLNCNKPDSTIEITQCLQQNNQKLIKQMQQYLDAALKKYQQDKPTLAAIKQSQQAWAAYQKSQCAAVYSIWRQGTIRGIENLYCQKDMIVERSYQIWKQFLTDLTGQSPLLPDPRKMPQK
ncbi:MAG: lysozyme inhibitor LprI family protein [Parashewanella sp.]